MIFAFVAMSSVSPVASKLFVIGFASLAARVSPAEREWGNGERKGKGREREREKKKGETKKSLMSTWCEQSHKIDKSCKKIFFILI